MVFLAFQGTSTEKPNEGLGLGLLKLRHVYISPSLRLVFLTFRQNQTSLNTCIDVISGLTGNHGRFNQRRYVYAKGGRGE